MTGKQLATLACGVMRLIGTLVAFTCCSAPQAKQPPRQRSIPVASLAQLRSALAAAKPEDVIEVADGEYRTRDEILVTRSGTAKSPIVVRAQNRGKATITGAAGFELTSVGYVVIEGFTFAHDNTDYAVLTRSCHHVRITRNRFRLHEVSPESQHWLNITGEGSHHNRVDHNVFEEKHELGCFIVTGGSGEPEYQSTRHDRIDHNHFRNNGPRVQNGMESIRLGVSTLSESTGFITVEHNLFEDCDGDPEIVSIKSCDETVRYNTFVNCQGAVVARAGHRNTIEGNFFLCTHGKKGVGGIRVHGDDHKVLSNYLECLTDEGFVTTNGDMVVKRTEGGTYFQTRRGVVAFNTWVNCAGRIFDIGSDKGGKCTLVPENCTIANNLVAGGERELVRFRSKPKDLRWSGNIAFPRALLDEVDFEPAESEIRVVNPGLVESAGIWRLSEDSPAIDAASGAYASVAGDIDGQPRDEEPDVGADEYSQAPITRRPLTPADVGVDAPE